MDLLASCLSQVHGTERTDVFEIAANLLLPYPHNVLPEVQAM
jgi:hypothetical protein